MLLLSWGDKPFSDTWKMDVFICFMMILTKVNTTYPWAVARQHLGERAAQQDAYGFGEAGPVKIAVLADGMGGRAAGDAASRCAVDTALYCLLDQVAKIAACDSELHQREMEGIFIDAIDEAERMIEAKVEEDAQKEGMGTTLDILVFVHQLLFYAHVGDGRVYAFNAADAALLTQEHTVQRRNLQERNPSWREVVEGRAAISMYESALRRETEGRNALTSALGLKRTLLIQFGVRRLNPGTRVCAAVDGAYMPFAGSLHWTLIGNGAKTLEEIAEAVFSVALDEATDNLTALFIDPWPSEETAG
jgi:protein phosphatase